MRGHTRVIAINESWRLAPWADVLYACDDNFWKAKQGVPDFAGMKVTQDAKAKARYPKLNRVICDRSRDDLVLEAPGVIGWGGNSGFHAINLAAQWGVKKIILVGFDMTLAHGLHWHGRHPWSMNNPTVTNVERWRRVTDAAAPLLRDRGIEVINCSEVSALNAYPKMSLAEALGTRGASIKILAIGPQFDGPERLTNFSGVYSYYISRELNRQNCELVFAPRPDQKSAAEFYEALDLDDIDHIIAFGSRHFERIDGKIARWLSRRIKGAVCQFNDSPLVSPSADLTFVFKGAPQPKHVTIGWAADPELCTPQQAPDMLQILVDHRDYVMGRGDVSQVIRRDVERFAASRTWRRRFRKINVQTLGSPKENGISEQKAFTEICKDYSRAHVFCLTHPESVGLSVIETSTAGALALIPKDFMSHELLKSVRHIEYKGAIPWDVVLRKINVKASRERASRETWANVANRIMKRLREYRK